MQTAFTPSHRGGTGSPMVLLHGFADTWRTWELVLPALERRHDVLAVTLAGHAGGPPLDDPLTDDTLADAVERAMDEAGFELAHLVGNSLGGSLALQLAARGRARTVVALAPAGGWASDDRSYVELLRMQRAAIRMLRGTAPQADALVATPRGRRRVTQLLTVRDEHIPAPLLAHLMLGGAACSGAEALIDHALAAGWPFEPERIACPVRIVWGTEDLMLPWPSAAARFRAALPHADWVQLDGVGHCPQLDVPAEAADLILGFTGG
ncbi:MAG TPA: alpha/beta fold hydrolase [Capillimicrobium sp.]|nr:alpha/beta fold hydrolase [Capillimicrobium sp.]